MDHIKNSTKHFSTQRIEAFTDGVLAIVATLLILNIEIPENMNKQELPGEILALWPHYISYILSFIIVGMYWYIHHLIMKVYTRIDAVTLWLNLLFLMVVAFIPFPTDLMAEYKHDVLTIIIFGAIQVVTGLILAALWIYSTYFQNHVSKEVPAPIVNKITTAVLAAPALNLIAIFTAFFHVYISLILFLIAPVLYVVLTKHKHNPETQSTNP